MLYFRASLKIDIQLQLKQPLEIVVKFNNHNCIIWYIKIETSSIFNVFQTGPLS